jgi:hypothetical protein
LLDPSHEALKNLYQEVKITFDLLKIMQGRFLAVAGFGNLPGDIGFHEKQADDKCTPLGAAK